jgi:flagellin
MPQTINTNVSSLNAQRNLTTSQNSLATSMQRLSSGLRVNSAKDDAAGLAIADRMNAQCAASTSRSAMPTTASRWRRPRKAPSPP